MGVRAADGHPDWEGIFCGNASTVDYPGCAFWRELDFAGKLLDRSAKGATLTAFGKTVYVRAKRILAEWRHLDNERVALFNGLAGHITVGIARGTGFLGRVIPAVMSGVASELTHALRLGDLDFAVAVLDGVKTDADLVQEVLFYDRCGLFADARHPLAGRSTSSIAISRRTAGCVRATPNHCVKLSSGSPTARESRRARR